jgi:hypothetical protein
VTLKCRAGSIPARGTIALEKTLVNQCFTGVFNLRGTVQGQNYDCFFCSPSLLVKSDKQQTIDFSHSSLIYFLSFENLIAQHIKHNSSCNGLITLGCKQAKFYACPFPHPLTDYMLQVRV